MSSSAALRWSTANAYVSATSIDTDIYAGHDLSYIYRKPNLKKRSDPYQLYSVNSGAGIVSKWFEKVDNDIGIEREVKFSFEPNERPSQWERPSDAANDHGWKLDTLEILDDSFGSGNSQMLVWDRDLISSPRYRSSSAQSTDAFLTVPANYDIFYCEYIELSLYRSSHGRLDTSVPEGKYVATDFVLGAFLPTDEYSCSNWYDRNNGPDCTGARVYNPCRGTGKTCAAVNGDVYCGTEKLGQSTNNDDTSSYSTGTFGSSNGNYNNNNNNGYNTDRSPFSFSGSPLDAKEWTDRYGVGFEWNADNSYLKVERSTVALQGALEDGRENEAFYTFEDDYRRNPTLTSGTNGQQIGRSYPWMEDGTYRGLTFSFQPNQDTSANYDPQQDAMDSGWTMTTARVRDENGRWTTWTRSSDSTSNSASKYEDDWLSVPKGNTLFYCQSVELNFYSTVSQQFNGGISPRSRANAAAKFVGRNVLLGAFLNDGYSVYRMDRYNPCGDGRDCRIVDSALYCDNQIVERKPDEADALPVSWKGYRSFFESKDVAVFFPDGDKYSFEDDRRREPYFSSGRDGNVIGWTNNWYEAGKRRHMQIEVLRNDESSISSSGWHFKSLSLLDNNGETISFEGNPYGRPTSTGMTTFIAVPEGYDSFHCEHVELSLRNDVGRRRGNFVAEDFALGAYLRTNYQYSSFRRNEYNPCKQLQNGGECRIRDSTLMCGGNYINFDDLVGDFSSVNEITTSSFSSAGGSFSRTTMVTMGLYVAAGAAAGLLFM